MIPVPSGVQVWLATGHTDMRKGFDGLALLVQETLKRNPRAVAHRMGASYSFNKCIDTIPYVSAIHKVSITASFSPWHWLFSFRQNCL